MPKGPYIVRGKNPDGSKYYGTAFIINDENSFRMTTFVGTQVFDYRGRLEESEDLDLSLLYKLVLKEKKHTVAYSVHSDSILVGNWGTGGAEELIRASPFAETPFSDSE
jgi:hypothetical protein